MPIPTLDDGLAGNINTPIPLLKAVSGTLVAGRAHSFWTRAGSPGAGAAAANTAGGVVPTASTAGAIRHVNPATGTAHLSGGDLSLSAQRGLVLICDRLLHIQGNSGGTAIDETLTTAQTINSTTLPSRCPTSAIDETPSTNGYGVLAAVEVVTALGAGTPTLTIGYTNDAGTAGRTANSILATAASPIVGSTYIFGLQAGDTGVRSWQTYQQSATWTSGQINLVLFRVVRAFSCVQAGVPAMLDPIASGGPRIYDNSCLYAMVIPETTTTTALTGFLNISNV